MNLIVQATPQETILNSSLNNNPLNIQNKEEFCNKIMQKMTSKIQKLEINMSKIFSKFLTLNFNIETLIFIII